MMDKINKQRLEYIKKMEEQIDTDQHIKPSDLAIKGGSAILEMRDGEV